MFDYQKYQDQMRSLDAYPDAPLNRRFKRIIEAVPSGSRVLDIACGSGTLLAALRDKACHCVGIDISPGAVELCSAKGLTAIQGDVDAFDSDQQIRSLISDTYDVVLFSKCLMYLKRKRELMAALKTRVIIINQGNPYYWRYLLGIEQPPPETFPYVQADNSIIEIKKPHDLVRWGETFGYRGKVLYGGRLRGRDMVVWLEKQ